MHREMFRKRLTLPTKGASYEGPLGGPRLGQITAHSATTALPTLQTVKAMNRAEEVPFVTFTGDRQRYLSI